MALPVAATNLSSLVDPCRGYPDLMERVLRVNYPEAIEDDPIRALRAIRLLIINGFIPTDKTIKAISTAAPMLSEVSAERVRDELLKILGSDQPDKALTYLRDWKVLPTVLPELDKLENVPLHSNPQRSLLLHTGILLKYLAAIESMLAKESISLENESGEILDRIGQIQELLKPFRGKLTSYLTHHLPGGVAGSTLVRLGALFHSVGIATRLESDPDQGVVLTWDDTSGSKAAAEALRQLRLSNQVIHHVSACIAGHMRPRLLLDKNPLSDRMIYRFFNASDPAGIDILLVSLAQALAIFDESSEFGKWRQLLAVVSQLLDGYFNRYNTTIRPDLLVNGNTLIKHLSLEPGPEVGRLLEIVEEAQAAGEISSIEEALALARMESGR
jgi:tRNA nucleotidyltransferase/poly(A) polymerase